MLEKIWSSFAKMCVWTLGLEVLLRLEEKRSIIYMMAYPEMRKNPTLKCDMGFCEDDIL